MMDFDEKYNVCGTMLSTDEITREVLVEWEKKEPKSRELFNYRYGHNYSSLKGEAKKMGYLQLYKMFDLELTKEEVEELDRYNYAMNTERERREDDIKNRKKEKGNKWTHKQ